MAEITSWTSEGMDWSTWENIKPWEAKWFEALRLAAIERCDAMGISYGGRHLPYPTPNPGIFVPVMENLSQCMLINYEKMHAIEYLIQLCFDSANLNSRGFCKKLSEPATWETLVYSAYDGTKVTHWWWGGGEYPPEIPFITYNEAMVNADVWIPDLSRDMLITNDYIKKWFWLQHKLLNQLLLLKGKAAWHSIFAKSLARNLTFDMVVAYNGGHWNETPMLLQSNAEQEIEAMNTAFPGESYSKSGHFVGEEYTEISSAYDAADRYSIAMCNAYGFLACRNLAAANADINMYTAKASGYVAQLRNGDSEVELDDKRVIEYNKELYSGAAILAKYIMSPIAGDKEAVPSPTRIGISEPTVFSLDNHLGVPMNHQWYSWDFGAWHVVSYDRCFIFKGKTMSSYTHGFLPDFYDWGLFELPTPFFTMDYNIEGGFRFRPPAA